MFYPSMNDKEYDSQNMYGEGGTPAPQEENGAYGHPVITSFW